MLFLSLCDVCRVQAFFKEANRILRTDGGMLTIVTDNLWYGRFLMRQVAGLQAKSGNTATSWRSMSLTSARNAGATHDEWRVQESDGEVNLFVGRPGIAAGHVVDASSYFDRLWKRGSLVERYFLVLKKGGAASSSMGPAAKQRELVSASLKNISTGGKTHMNKNMKANSVSSGGNSSVVKAERNHKHKKSNIVKAKK